MVYTGGKWQVVAKVSAPATTASVSLFTPVIGMMYAGGKWQTFAEVSAPATTASVSLFTLDSPYEYMFRVFAVNARGLGHASPDSDSLLMSGKD